MTEKPCRRVLTNVEREWLLTCNRGVYFAAFSADDLKIGMSRSVAERFKQHQREYPCAALLGVIACLPHELRRREIQVQWHFRAFHRDGELFELTDESRSLVEAVLKQPQVVSATEPWWSMVESHL